MTLDPSSQLIAELDAVHALAKKSFQGKDFIAYMDTFSPALSYRQLDGRIINRDQLARDVAAQFQSVRELDSSYVRESMEVDGSEVIEILRQDAWAEVRAFLFIKRRWKLNRRSRCVWTSTPNGWKIIRVEVLEEAIS